MPQHLNLETFLWWVSVLDLGFQGRRSLRWYDMTTPDFKGFKVHRWKSIPVRFEVSYVVRYGFQGVRLALGVNVSFLKFWIGSKIFFRVMKSEMSTDSCYCYLNNVCSIWLCKFDSSNIHRQNLKRTLWCQCHVYNHYNHVCRLEDENLTLIAETLQWRNLVVRRLLVKFYTILSPTLYCLTFQNSIASRVQYGSLADVHGGHRLSDLPFRRHPSCLLILTPSPSTRLKS